MKNTLLIAALSLLLLWPVQALASSGLCIDVNPDAIDDASIAAGAVSGTARTDVRSYRELVIVVDLTDANNLVTDLSITFTNAYAETGGIDRVIGAGCDVAAGVLTCYPLTLKWNPQTQGKNYEIPIPNAYDWIIPTVTPTGHGAGDKVSVAIRGCM